MANDARYQAMLTYLRTCPTLAGVLDFQTGNSNNVRVMTQASESNVRTFIDGSKEKRFDFVIEFRKTLNSAPYVDTMGGANQNLETLLDVQSLIDWLDSCNNMGIYPDFGADCIVDTVFSTSSEPVLAWIDTSGSLPIAKYTVTVRTVYTDYSHTIYHNETTTEQN